MSTFMQYAILASGEALEDAGWRPQSDQQREMTVGRVMSGFSRLIQLSQSTGCLSRLWDRKPRGAISDLDIFLSSREILSDHLFI